MLGTRDVTADAALDLVEALAALGRLWIDMKDADRSVDTPRSLREFCVHRLRVRPGRKSVTRGPRLPDQGCNTILPA
jgi:hypothetical protein